MSYEEVNEKHLQDLVYDNFIAELAAHRKRISEEREQIKLDIHGAHNPTVMQKSYENRLYWLIEEEHILKRVEHKQESDHAIVVEREAKQALEQAKHKELENLKAKKKTTLKQHVLQPVAQRSTIQWQTVKPSRICKICDKMFARDEDMLPCGHYCCAKCFRERLQKPKENGGVYWRSRPICCRGHLENRTGRKR